MTIVHDVFNLTHSFLEEITQPSPKHERDQLILKINEFLDKREILLKDMKGSYTQEEKRLGKHLVDCDQKLQELFLTIKQEIQQDFIAAKRKKKHTPKYINPYTNVFNEGAYLDKRN